VSNDGFFNAKTIMLPFLFPPQALVITGIRSVIKMDPALQLVIGQPEEMKNDTEDKMSANQEEIKNYKSAT
jgi:hypothetical protein